MCKALLISPVFTHLGQTGQKLASPQPCGCTHRRGTVLTVTVLRKNGVAASPQALLTRKQRPAELKIKAKRPDSIAEALGIRLVSTYSHSPDPLEEL